MDIGTMAISAVVVDISRLIVHAVTLFSRDFAMLTNQGGIQLVAAESLVVFAGAFIGSRILKKITMRAIQAVVGMMLIVLSIDMGAGIP